MSLDMTGVAYTSYSTVSLAGVVHYRDWLNCGSSEYISQNFGINFWTGNQGRGEISGWIIVDVYTDDDYSGLYDDRPAFDKLIRDGKLGKFNVIIAKSQSRFTRNMEHMERYLHHDFPLLGIRFIGVVDGVDTNVKGNKKARQIYGLTNEWYCEDLSENIRSVFKQKMKAGQFLGGFAPYGYMKDPMDGHKFLIDETAANVVRRIYHLFI